MSERKPDGAGDQFESREMTDGSPVVHRDKIVSRFMAALMMAPAAFCMFIAAYIAVVNGTSPKPLPAAALPFVVAALAGLGLMFVVLSLTLSVVRTVVTGRAVHVRYGLWGPSIPIDAIRSCKVIDYEWQKFGGWGIRHGDGGTWAYVPRGGRVVELKYLEDGVEKRVLVGAENADETALQIDRVRTKRVRIADAPPADEDVAAEVEAEAEATEEVSGRGRG